jgi:lipopolysaccharide transport system permease protein
MRITLNKILNYSIDGFKDFKESLLNKDAWYYLGIHDVKLRYRRSIIGPWWVTISTLILVIALGFLWSKLFNTEIREYMPFFTIGYIFWTFFLNQTTDSLIGFTQFSEIIKQINLPYPVFLNRILVRNIVALLHNFVVMFLVIYFVGDGLNSNSIWFFPGFIVIIFLLIPYSVILAFLATRFRDLSPAIMSVMQIFFFFTPIIWQPNILPERYFFALDFNPIFHALEIVRSPLLGQVPPLHSYIIVLTISLILWLVSVFILGRFKKRLVYWI